jgi:exopolysaccharide biosynthesis polyprenyl glycosylphosphotransferase
MMHSGQTVKVGKPLPSRLIAILLLLSDFLGFLLCHELASRVLSGTSILDVPHWSLLLFTPLAITGLYMMDTYHPETQSGSIKLLERVVLSSVFVLFLEAVFVYLCNLLAIRTSLSSDALFVGLTLFTLWAGSLRFLIARQVGIEVQQSHWIVLGGHSNLKDIINFFELSFHQAGVTFLTHDLEVKTALKGSRFETQDCLERLPDFGSQRCSGVLVDPHLHLSEVQMQDLMRLRLQGIRVYSLPDFFEHFWMKVPPLTLQDNWFAFTSGFVLLHNLVYLRIKRLFDICVAGTLLLALSPLFAIAALAIKLDSPGTIFYSQMRTGLNYQQFRVLKFRSMRQNAEAKGPQWASQQDPRITRVGRFIRAMRIDELPQLLNVLLGQMSLIGPRPERPEFDAELARSIPYYNIRYLVRPGITGWAQVMYPYGASVEDAYEKFSYDLYYIKNYSPLLDLNIVIKTIRVVLFGKGR